MTPTVASLPVSYQDVATAADRIRALVVNTTARSDGAV